MFDGTNEPTGARFTYYINKPKKDKKKKEKDDKDSTDKKDKPSPDSLTVRIYDAVGNEVRTMYTKVDTSLQRMYWNYETNGIRNPGSKTKAKKRK